MSGPKDLRGHVAAAAARKTHMVVMTLPRLLARLRARPADYAHRPPIVVNSLPKSGTHLMMQLAAALPGAVHYGNFIAQHPYLTLRTRGQAEIDARIEALAPGEVVGAHLYHTVETAAALARRGALHLFIWRDLRDVILSEAHYLSHMAWRHAMHKTFRALPDAAAQVDLAIRGTGTPIYPAARDRFAPYLGWIAPETGAEVFRYEQLMDPAHQAQEIARLEAVFRAHCPTAPADAGLQDRIRAALRPERSHTFHKGGVARWKTDMEPDHQRLCEEEFGAWLTL